MKINRRDSSKKKFIVASLILVLLLAIGGAIYAYASGVFGPSKQSMTGHSSQHAENADDGANEDNNEEPSSESPDKTPVQNEDETEGKSDPESANNSSASLSGVINYKQVSSGKLSIRVTIDQKLDSGSCKLTLTRSSDKKKVQESAEIVANPSSSTCKGFDIPVSELGNGSWKINVDLNSGNASGSISGSVTI